MFHVPAPALEPISGLEDRDVDEMVCCRTALPEVEL